MATPSSVLIIEDDFEIRKALLDILRSEGYSVQAATDGQEALEVLRKGAQKPNVIILDLMMPVMDGWIFRNHQLQDPSIAKIPVIVITAEGTAKAKAKAMNAVAGIRKPIDLDELLGTLRTCLALEI
jgi:CheY-like chemotaxis protein